MRSEPVPSGRACAKCGGWMEVGWVADSGHYNAPSRSVWVRGVVRMNSVLGIKWLRRIDRGDKLKIRTERCTSCGYLESYAPDVVAPPPRGPRGFEVVRDR